MVFIVYKVSSLICIWELSCIKMHWSWTVTVQDRQNPRLQICFTNLVLKKCPLLLSLMIYQYFCFETNGKRGLILDSVHVSLYRIGLWTEIKFFLVLHLDGFFLNFAPSSSEIWRSYFKYITFMGFLRILDW